MMVAAGLHLARLITFILCTQHLNLVVSRSIEVKKKLMWDDLHKEDLVLPLFIFSGFQCVNGPCQKDSKSSNINRSFVKHFVHMYPHFWMWKLLSSKFWTQICIILDAQQPNFHHPFQELHIHFFVTNKIFQAASQKAIIHPTELKCFISCRDIELHTPATNDLQQHNPKAVDIGFLSY